MSHASSLFLSSLLILPLVGCGTSPTDTGPACPSGNCGKPTFRVVVPTRDKLALAHPTGKTGAMARARPALTSAPAGHTRSVVALEAVSPALLAVDDHVVEVNEVIAAVITDIEQVAGTTPEIETETEHQWRRPSADLPGHDDVLRIGSTNGTEFEIAYYVVASGAAPSGTPVIFGDAVGNDAEDDFHLTIDLDAAAVADPKLEVTGDIVIAAMPLAGGLRERWYDFHDVSLDGGPTETSRTTAWDWAEGSGALELVAVIEGNPVTVYARWDDRGGRYDHHTAWNEPELGLVDEIATNCWNPTGGEQFNAWAIIDQALNFYGELEGDEAACAFGPVADHPTPGEDFDDLPGEGEWQTLELLSW